MLMIGRVRSLLSTGSEITACRSPIPSLEVAPVGRTDAGAADDLRIVGGDLPIRSEQYDVVEHDKHLRSLGIEGSDSGRVVQDVARQ